MKKVFLWMLLIILCILITSVLSLFGCRAETTVEEEAVEEEAEEEEAVEEEAEEEEAEEAILDNKRWQGQEVQVLMMGSAPNQYFPELVPAFEEKYGVTVELVTISEEGYNEKSNLELLGSEGTFSVIWEPWRIFHEWVTAGWIEPLDRYINDPEIVDTEQLGIEGFSQLALDSLKFEGKQMGLPVHLGSIILTYREDVIEAAGITSPPDTWEELYDAASKVTGMEIEGKTVYGIGMRGSQKGGGVGFHWPMILEAFGGSIVADYPEDMHPTLDEPEAINAAEFYADMLQNYGFPGTTTAHWKEVMVAYQTGILAFYPDDFMLTSQALDPKATEQYVIDNTGFAIVPAGPSGRVSGAAVHGLGIPMNAPNKELGYKFIEWILSHDVQSRNLLEYGVLVTIRPDMMLEYKEEFDPEWAEVVSESVNEHFNALFRPMCKEWGDIEENIGIAMSNVLTGQEEASEALPKANEAIYNVLKDAGYFSE